MKFKADNERRQNEFNTLQVELAKQHDLNAQLLHQRKANESSQRDQLDEMEQLRVRCERLEEQRTNLAGELEQCEERLHAEKRQKEEVSKGLFSILIAFFIVSKK